MARFSDLSNPADVEVRLAQAAEACMISAPLQSLLLVRQIFELQADRLKTNIGKLGFRSSWQNILHARDAVLEPKGQRRAAANALSATWSLLGLNRLGNWQRNPPKASRADREPPSFALLQLRYDALNGRHGQERMERSDIEQLRQALKADRRAFVSKGAPSADEKTCLALYDALVEQALPNHAGHVQRLSAETKALCQRALEGTHLHQRLAIELLNREAIALTNGMHFSEAMSVLEPIERRFNQGSTLKDEAVGAVLGSLGQAKGFVASTQRNAELAQEAGLWFEEAAKHFGDAGALDRQRTYALHALCTQVRLGSTESRASLEAAVQERGERLLGWARGEEFGSRVDYPLAVWLKALHALGRPVPSHALLVQAWEPQVNWEQLMPSQLHGPLLASGWLALTSSGTVPRTLRKGIAHAEQHGKGVVKYLATVFAAHLDWAAGVADRRAVGDRMHAAATPDVRAWWSTNGLGKRLDEACEEGGYGPISLVPFNHA